ncbi:MAG: hypothetical protein Q7J64_06350, partial [Elusimicrobiota bacterium]|nr:hypothetical protein [Elusimicrobiota bacterium]
MIKKTAKQVVSILCCSLLMSGASAPAFAQTMRGNIGGANIGAPQGAALTSAPAGLNPTLIGGVSSIKGGVTPTLIAPSIAPSPLSIPASVIPAAKDVSHNGFAEGESTPVNALSSVRNFAAAIGDENLPKGPDSAKDAADKAFDGTANN